MIITIRPGLNDPIILQHEFFITSFPFVLSPIDFVNPFIFVKNSGIIYKILYRLITAQLTRTIYPFKINRIIVMKKSFSLPKSGFI